MNSIMWNPIQAPDLSSVSNLYGAASNYISAGMQGLTNIVDAQKEIEQNKTKQDILDQTNKAKAMLISNVRSSSDLDQFDFSKLTEGMRPEAASEVLNFRKDLSEQLANSETAKAKILEAGVKQGELDLSKAKAPFEFAEKEAAIGKSQAETAATIRKSKQEAFGNAVIGKTMTELRDALTSGQYTESEIREQVDKAVNFQDKDSKQILTDDQKKQLLAEADRTIGSFKYLSDADKQLINYQQQVATNKIHENTDYNRIVRAEQQYLDQQEANKPEPELYNQKTNIETRKGFSEWMGLNKVTPEKQQAIMEKRLTDKILGIIGDPDGKSADLQSVKNSLNEMFPADFPEEMKQSVLNDLVITTTDNLAALSITPTESNVFQNISTVFSNGVNEQKFHQRRREWLYNRGMRQIKYLQAKHNLKTISDRKTSIENSVNVVKQVIMDKKFGFKIDPNSQKIYDKMMSDNPAVNNDFTNRRNIIGDNQVNNSSLLDVATHLSKGLGNKAKSDVFSSLANIKHGNIITPNDGQSYIAKYGRKDSRKDRRVA